MNTNREIMPLCLLLATAGIGSAKADKTVDRKEIEGDYTRYAKAMKQKNIKPMFAMLTKDATFKGPDGSLTSRSQLEMMMKQEFATMTLTEFTPKITQWVWQENAALLDVTIKSASKVKGPDGKTHSVAYVSKSRNKWVKEPVGWRLQQIEAVGETMTRDGKTVVMPVPAPKK